MIKLTLTNSLTLAMLLCGGAMRIEASGDTPVTIKDGGSILLLAGGLDGGSTWTVSPSDLRHVRVDGVLRSLKITDGGADQCGGHPMCGIDATKPWKIRVIYNGRYVTIASVSANKGVHVRFSPKVPFDQWQKTANGDERSFGHGDGKRIGSIKLNGSVTSLCSGKGACEVDLVYTTP